MPPPPPLPPPPGTSIDGIDSMPLDTPPAQARLGGYEPQRRGQQLEQLAATSKTSDSSTAMPVAAAAVKIPRLICVHSLAREAHLGFQGSPRGGAMIRLRHGRRGCSPRI